MAIRRRIPRNRKPNYPVEIDWSHQFAPNKLCYLFNLSPAANYDLVSGKKPTITSGSDLSAKASIDGKLLNVAYNGAASASYSFTQFTLPDNDPWEITIRFKKGFLLIIITILCIEEIYPNLKF